MNATHINPAPSRNSAGRLLCIGLYAVLVLVRPVVTIACFVAARLAIVALGPALFVGRHHPIIPAVLVAVVIVASWLPHLFALAVALVAKAIA